MNDEFNVGFNSNTVIAILSGILAYLISFVTLRRQVLDHIKQDEKNLAIINESFNLLRMDIRDLRQLIIQNYKKKDDNK